MGYDYGAGISSDCSLCEAEVRDRPYRETGFSKWQDGKLPSAERLQRI